jgi:hypothetical protein
VVDSRVQRDVYPLPASGLTDVLDLSKKKKEPEEPPIDLQVEGPILAELPSNQSSPGSDTVQKWLAQVSVGSSPTSMTQIAPSIEDPIVKPQADRKLI